MSTDLRTIILYLLYILSYLIAKISKRLFLYFDRLLFES